MDCSISRQNLLDRVKSVLGRVWLGCDLNSREEAILYLFGTLGVFSAPVDTPFPFFGPYSLTEEEISEVRSKLDSGISEENSGEESVEEILVKAGAVAGQIYFVLRKTNEVPQIFTDFVELEKSLPQQWKLERKWEEMSDDDLEYWAAIADCLEEGITSWFELPDNS